MTTYMKTISLKNVSEPVYRDFLEHAKRTDRTAAELIREAMERYREDRIKSVTSLRERMPLHLGKVIKPLSREDRIKSVTSLRERMPLHLGKVIKPLSREDDILGEILSESTPPSRAISPRHPAATPERGS